MFYQWFASFSPVNLLFLSAIFVIAIYFICLFCIFNLPLSIFAGSCRQCGYSPPGGVYTTSGSYMFLNFQSQSQFTYASFDLIITSYHNGKLL